MQNITSPIKNGCSVRDDLGKLKFTLFLLFFMSGFAGLLYQVVWLRMAYATFGIITPVLSIVISVFMMGLAIGSISGGRIIDVISARTGLSPVFFYAFAECCIGAGAFLVPSMYRYGSSVLLMAGQMDSVRYLFLSALVIVASILPWCVFMGFTFPFMMSFVKNLNKSNTTGFSFLYLANVIGAMSGTIITALVLVELFGLRKTWTLAAYANFIIAAVSVGIGLLYPYRMSSLREIKPEISNDASGGDDATISSGQALILLLTTGLTSMSLEVIWIRAFTPAFGTSIYTFASILAVYLFATAVGSYMYRRHLKKCSVCETSKLITALTVSVFLPIVFGDRRFMSHETVYQCMILASIMPFCSLLGYLTPKLIDLYSQGRPGSAGYAYSLNIIGCIAGPILASYVFLQYLGIKFSMTAMALPFVAYYLSYRLRTPYRLQSPKWPSAAIGILLIIAVFVSYDHEMYYDMDGNIVARDYTATVVACEKGMDKRLYVNGISITNLTPITKHMAHMPLIFLDGSRYQSGPTVSALIICFGMGTTHRSMLSWNIRSTAVELIPSVKAVFPYFHDDAHSVLRNPNGTIVIDDGRRFLNRTTEKYDVITIDPPPPVEAAGSSLLYSEDFYNVIKAHLREGGVFQQWVPIAEEKIQQAIARSIINSFPYVRAFAGIEGWGVHFIASLSPIKTPQIEEIEARMPDTAQKDLFEWSDGKDIRLFMSKFLSQEKSIPQLLNPNSHILIDDNRPYNEYYFLRRQKAALTLMFGKLLK